MTPQELLAELLLKNEREGWQLLQTCMHPFDTSSIALLVELIKREADRQWNNNAQLSFVLAGYILTIGDLRNNKAYHALGLMARGDALRRMDRDEDALPFFDASGEEFKEVGDEVGWARTRIGRISACLQLNRTSEALRDATAAREVFMRYGKLLRAGQIDVNAAIVNYELGQYDQALRLFDRAIETYALQGEGVELNVARARGNKAITLAAQGKFREADVMRNEASIIPEEGGFMALASIVRLQQAELYFAGGQLDASLREAQHVADAFAEQEALPQLARTALLQARIAATTGDISTARYLCDHALDIAQGQGLLDLKYRCDYLLGQIAERSGDLDAAARYYDRAVQGIDEVQNHLVLDERTSFLEDKGNIYQRAIILAIKRDNKDQALIYVEKAKSRVIGDYLRNNIDIRLRAGDKAGESILEDLGKIREEQAWYSSIVYEAENEANLSDTAINRIRAIAA